ncbi:tyrosine-type recombinase/integrase [Cupriavidus necator]
MEANEVKALLSQIDRSTRSGQRDYALFALMFNTGARVQEVLDLRRCDVRTEPPYQVRLLGKGGKVRICPIWANTCPKPPFRLGRLQRPVPKVTAVNPVELISKQVAYG